MSRILIVDDQENQRKIIADILTEQNHRVFQAANVDEALERIKDDQMEVVLTDLKMPGKGGLALVAEIAKTPSAPEVIVMTAFGTIETAIKAIRLGAYDYLTKPLKPEELLFLIDKAQEKYQLKQESRHLRQELVREIFSKLIAKSMVMQDIMGKIEKVATTDSTVLIRGETGTGKECVARLIHVQSKRSHQPMQSINCAAFTETLLDSELFGYEKGAFTGAQTRKTGIVESAADGTLFLDEIGDMAPSTQTKILRVIQEKSIRRVGGIEDIPVNIRIIAATNKNLEESISLGTFREDLYYRLNIVPLVIPPLRERKDDIPELIIQFFSKLSKPKAVEADALKLMLEYHWPGNVRELEAVIERIAIFSNKNTVTVADLPPEITQRNSSTTCSPWDLPDKGIVFEEWERHLFAKALEKAGGNMVAAAKLLGMSYRAFRYRAHAFGLKEE